MAEKSFGIKEIKFFGSSPKIESPNNLNLNAVNVAISTNATIGGTLSVTGNVSVGGTLTYEDLTNIDSVGLITARSGIDCNGDIDVDGHTNLDNTDIVGILTVTSTTQYGGFKLSNNSNIVAELVGLSGSNDTGALALWEGGSKYVQLSASGNSFINGGNFAIAKDLDVDGHTNLDNVSIAGVLTATSFVGDGSNLTGITVTPTNSDIQVVYTVTANGSSAYRFGGNGIVSTADNPDVYLIRGLKYRFINNSGGSHPFQIRQSSGGSAYSAGVTNNGAASGNIDFQVPYSAPSHLYYQCTSHGGMVGNLYIRGAGGQNTNVGVTTFSDKAFFRDDLTVSSSGLAVNIFESTDNHSRLRIRSADASLAQLEFADQSDADAGEIRYDHGNDRMTFHVGSNNEKLRIETDGDVIWNGTGTVTPGYGSNTTEGIGFEPRNGTIFLSRADNFVLHLNRNNDGRVITFAGSGTSKFNLSYKQSAGELSFTRGTGEGTEMLNLRSSDGRVIVNDDVEFESGGSGGIFGKIVRSAAAYSGNSNIDIGITGGNYIFSVRSAGVYHYNGIFMVTYYDSADKSSEEVVHGDYQTTATHSVIHNGSNNGTFRLSFSRDFTTLNIRQLKLS